MAKTHTIKLENISHWQNVAWALQRACRGKRQQPAVQHVVANAEQYINGISESLRQGRLPVGEFTEFEIFDPKRRVIHAATLADRVAHHALVRHLEPALEKALLSSVFACRTGKGVHRAIHYAQQQARRFPWVMHIDIAGYFPSISHPILLQQLTKRFRGNGMLLVRAVVQAFGAGKGLPIGALTSQHFANHYLNSADRWALAQPEVCAHCRYMDDFLLWADDGRALKQLRQRFADYLQQRLALEIKPPLIQRSDQGIRFCGIHIKTHQLRASQRRRRRFRHSVAIAESAWQGGQLTSLGLQRHYDAARAIMLPADDPRWRAQCAKHAGQLDV